MQKEKFIDFLSSEKRFSENTITSYSVDLEQFILFLKYEYQIKDDISDISFQIVRSWIATLLEKGVSATSVTRKISTLRTYFKFLIKEEVIKDNLLKLSLISLSAICFMPHQLHDYVLLLPLLIYSVKNFNLFLSKINLLFVIYFFFILRIISFFFNIQPWEFPYNFWGYFNNLICLVILSYNYLI